MLRDFVSDLFDGRNRSIEAVSEAIGVDTTATIAILIALGYEYDHTGKESGKVYFSPA